MGAIFKRGSNGGTLTAKEADFVQARASGLSKRAAARVAGYSAPESAAPIVSKRPAVAAAVAAARARLIERGHDVALRVLVEVVEDRDAKTDYRIKAAGLLLLHARDLGKRDGARADRPMTELSEAELVAIITRGGGPVIDGQAIELTAIDDPVQGDSGADLF